MQIKENNNKNEDEDDDCNEAANINDEEEGLKKLNDSECNND